MSRFLWAFASVLLLCPAGWGHEPAAPRREPRLHKTSTKHYTILSDLDRAERRTVARFVEAMHRTYREVFRAEPVRTVPRPTVRVYRNREDYAAYCLSQDPDWTGNARGMFFHDPNTLASYRGRKLEDCLSVLSHEGFHQFSLQYFSPANSERPPHWLEEGLGDYFRSQTVRSGRLVHQIKGYHFRRVKHSLRERRAWSLAEIWSCDPSEIEDPAAFEIFYSYAYAMVAYLADVSPQTLKRAFRLKRRGLDNDALLDRLVPQSKRRRFYESFLAWVDKQPG
ncbi:MAG: DUF1570 domain-containing protein [Planctomycetota bacterium]|nr:MAG: DUF1570 domain-containing protein [Planctomycetota bacterium]